MIITDRALSFRVLYRENVDLVRNLLMSLFINHKRTNLVHVTLTLSDGYFINIMCFCLFHNDVLYFFFWSFVTGKIVAIILFVFANFATTVCIFFLLSSATGKLCSIIIIFYIHFSCQSLLLEL